MPPPYLPAYVEQHRRRKASRKGSLLSRKRTWFLFACGFLVYVGWNRLRDHSNEGELAERWPARRDLKERRPANDGSLVVGADKNMWTNLPHPRVTETFPANINSRRLLLATHSRVMWYYYDTEELKILHEGQGIYYGGFPGEELDAAGMPTTVWLVSRPHNWRPATSQEWLLQLDAVTGEELRRVKLDSKFTHDTVRRGNRVYAADCGRGAVVELEFPSMKQLRRMELFTEKEHVNTLSPTANGKMWAMLHNLGPSVLAQIDLATGKVDRRLPDVGLKSHGAVQWREKMVALDSDNAALMTIDLNSGRTQRLWADGEPMRYLKGLAVVDDIAFFGIAEKQTRENRASPDLNCELAAFDLAENVMLWRRVLPTQGLLNVVSAPHLQVESTAYAVWLSDVAQSYRTTRSYTWALAQNRKSYGGVFVDVGDDGDVENDDEDEGEMEDWEQQEAPKEDPPSSVKPKLTLMESEPLPETDPMHKFPPVIGGHWQSGYPRLDLRTKQKNRGLSAGAQLLLYHENVMELRDYVMKLPDEDWLEANQRKSNAWLEGRSNNLNQFKPGTSGIHLIFSDNDGTEVFEFPWYRDRFKHLVEPMLVKLLGDDTRNIIRLQLARMPGDTHIKRHLDSGDYSNNGHRLHIIVASSPKVSFHVCEKSVCLPIHVEEGLVFELNNRLDHYVDNDGAAPRVHMVIDVAESPRERKLLARGETCRYLGKKIACGEELARLLAEENST